MRRAILAVLVVGALVFGSATAVAAWYPHSKYTAISVANPNNPAQVSSKLVREKTPYAVYLQHITALNNCDWLGLMQQYPDQYTSDRAERERSSRAAWRPPRRLPAL